MGCCQGCCVFPHGRLSIYTLILGISCYLFSQSMTGGCYYVQVNVALSETFADQGSFQVEDFKTGFGPIAYEDTFREDGSEWTCYYYTSEMLDAMDAKFMTARVFAILANIFIGIAMVLLIAASCVEYTVGALKAIGGMLAFGSFCTWFTFLIFGSEPLCKGGLGECSFSIGAGLAIAAGVLSLITAGVVCKLPPAVDGFSHPPGTEQAQAYSPGTQTVTETSMPDGTKKIVKTTVNADGSQTVEETVITP